MKKKYERFPVEAVIIEKRGDNLIKTKDRSGRIVEKNTQLSYNVLKKSGEKLPVFNHQWLLVNADKPATMFEKVQQFFMPTVGTIFLFKYGSMQYKPININATGEKMKLKAILNKDGTKLYRYEYAKFDPRWVLGALNFDVVDWDNINFMVQEQRASVIRRAHKGDWLKQIAVPAMIIAGSVIVGLFILKFSSDVGADLRGGAGAPVPEAGGSKIFEAINDGVQPGA